VKLHRTHLGVSDKLLLAAWSLERDANKSPFSAEDLVVRAWELFPETFGLAGYLDESGKPVYPDSNRVFAEIMGSKPLRRMGLLQKAGQKLYVLTQSGREHARILEEYSPSHRYSGRAILSRQAKSEINRLLTSNAFLKFRFGHQDEVTFHDACTFWAASPRSKAVTFGGRLTNVARVLTQARDAMKDGAVVLEHGRKHITEGDLEQLEMLHQHLTERFCNELQTIMKRTDERGG